jgi:PAS domain S-box-containing protein
MRRWRGGALFYPAVFVASWLGGLPSGLAATAIATALVPVFFMGSRPPDLTAPANLISIFIFVTMGISISVVHERLRTSMALLERSRKWLQAIMDNSPNVIVIKDMSGEYLMANRQLEELLHIGPAKATGKSDAALFARRAPSIIAERTPRCLRNAARSPTRRPSCSGEQRVFLTSKFPLYNSAPYPFALCAIWSDITERKRVEEALREREADLREAERVAILGSWVWNVADDTSRWSEELYRIMGMEPPTPTNKPIAGADRPMHPRASPSYATRSRRSFATAARTRRRWRSSGPTARRAGSPREGMRCATNAARSLPSRAPRRTSRSSRTCNASATNGRR